MIIIVSFEYTWFVGIFRWLPKIWDTIIPFFLGLSEVNPMFFHRSSQLVVEDCSILCYRCWGFFNTLINCKEYLFGENKQAYRRTKKALKWDIWIACIEAIICICGWIFSPIKVQILCLFLLFALLVALVWKEEKYLKGLYSDFGLIR